jgi:hypothetical protein
VAASLATGNQYDSLLGRDIREEADMKTLFQDMRRGLARLFLSLPKAAPLENLSDPSPLMAAPAPLEFVLMRFTGCRNSTAAQGDGNCSSNPRIRLPHAQTFCHSVLF